jgi:hypothetical protein
MGIWKELGGLRKKLDRLPFLIEFCHYLLIDNDIKPPPTKPTTCCSPQWNQA